MSKNSNIGTFFLFAASAIYNLTNALLNSKYLDEGPNKKPFKKKKYKNKFKRSSMRPGYGYRSDNFEELRTGFKRKETKMGRNDLCLCGSGKKYKQCCISKKNLP